MQLEDLRHSIDQVDDELIALLRKRMGFVKKVGELKHANGDKGSMIRPAREAAMMRRLVKVGGDIFSGGIIHSVWRSIIAGSTQQEAPFSLSIYAPDEVKTTYWLAREYFGADTFCRFHQNPLPVLHEVAANIHIVGVLPLSLHRGRPWWVEITELPARPLIFAKLPFIGTLPFETEPVIALAHVPAESSGDDVTVVVVEDGKSISRESILQHFAKNNIQARDILKYEEGTGSKLRRFQLFECDGFFTHQSATIETITQSLNALNTAESPLKIHVIGHFGFVSQV